MAFLNVSAPFASHSFIHSFRKSICSTKPLINAKASLTRTAKEGSLSRTSVSVQTINVRKQGSHSSDLCCHTSRRQLSQRGISVVDNPKPSGVYRVGNRYRLSSSAGIFGFAIVFATLKYRRLVHEFVFRRIRISKKISFKLRELIRSVLAMTPPNKDALAPTPF